MRIQIGIVPPDCYNLRPPQPGVDYQSQQRVVPHAHRTAVVNLPRHYLLSLAECCVSSYHPFAEFSCQNPVCV